MIRVCWRFIINMADPNAHHPQHSGGEHPEQHEHSDVSARGLTIFFAIFIVFALAAHVLLYYVYWGFDSIEAKHKAPQSAIRQEPAKPLIPLQGVPGLHAQSPAQDTRDYVNSQEIILRNYAPTTQPGIGQIPIARAMDLLVERDMLKSRPVDQEVEQP